MKKQCMKRGSLAVEVGQKKLQKSSHSISAQQLMR